MDFVYPHLSIVGIAAAAIAQFVLGFLWYSPMTPIGKRWIAEMGIDTSNAKPGPEMAFFPVSSILAAWAVAMVIGWSHATGLGNTVLAAWVVGAAVIAQVMSATVANSQSMTLGIIHVAYVVVGYAIMGALIGMLS
jgi:hypothetical protein